MLNAPSHQIMPKHASASFHNPMTVCLCSRCNAGYLHFQHHCIRDIACQHNVATTAQYKYFAAPVMWTGDKLLHIGCAMNAHQGVRTGHNAEGVAILQGGIFLD